MRFDDNSVKEYKVGSVDCSLCIEFRTSVLNYGEFNSTLKRMTGLEKGWVCQPCEYKLSKEKHNETNDSTKRRLRN